MTILDDLLAQNGMLLPLPTTIRFTVFRTMIFMNIKGESIDINSFSVDLESENYYFTGDYTS